MIQDGPVRISAAPKLKSASLIVGWSQDAGGVGSSAIKHLRRKLGGEPFAEIEPLGFFPLRGVMVGHGVAQFPESRFYCCREHSLVLFESELPRFEWHRFLSLILDVAERYCNVNELYTVGGMVAFGAHTTPRQMFAVTNCSGMKDSLRECGLAWGMDYETPPGQRPTLNSFLLWVARKRSIAGASLWTGVPFYLAAFEDHRASRELLKVFDSRFSLGFDFAELDEDVRRQNEEIAQVRFDFPEIDGYIQKLESNLGLTEQEAEQLAARIGQRLKKGN